jgi:hypothetical protein
MNTKTVHGGLRPGRRFLTRPDGVIYEHIRGGLTANVHPTSAKSRDGTNYYRQRPQRTNSERLKLAPVFGPRCKLQFSGSDLRQRDRNHEDQIDKESAQFSVQRQGGS